MSMSKILCVDDEPSILQAMRRQFHGKLQVDIAVGPEQGLQAIQQRGPYAVVVADMRMPVMDGATFLAAVKQRAPDTVRIMLSGNADQGTAIDAVNKGAIFRFLSKPCAPDELLKAVQEGIALHHAQSAERELLETTLAGCIKVLSEILSLVNPYLAGGAALLRDIAIKLAKECKVSTPWQVEVASMLCRLGVVTLPPELTARMSDGETLAPEGREFLARVPEIGHRLLKQIPRLEEVARIVLYHDKGYDGSGAPADGLQGQALPEGARILKCAAEYAQLVSRGIQPEMALVDMRAQARLFDPEVLSALSALVMREAALSQKRIVRSVELCELLSGQITASPILTQDGRLLLREGYPISEVVLERIRNLARMHGVRQPILIQDHS